MLKGVCLHLRNVSNAVYHTSCYYCGKMKNRGSKVQSVCTCMTFLKYSIAELNYKKSY